jgi:hypothetical protein
MMVIQLFHLIEISIYSLQKHTFKTMMVEMIIDSLSHACACDSVSFIIFKLRGGIFLLWGFSTSEYFRILDPRLAVNPTLSNWDNRRQAIYLNPMLQFEDHKAIESAAGLSPEKEEVHLMYNGLGFTYKIYHYYEMYLRLPDNHTSLYTIGVNTKCRKDESQMQRRSNQSMHVCRVIIMREKNDHEMSFPACRELASNELTSAKKQ